MGEGVSSAERAARGGEHWEVETALGNRRGDSKKEDAADGRYCIATRNAHTSPACRPDGIAFGAIFTARRNARGRMNATSNSERDVGIRFNALLDSEIGGSIRDSRLFRSACNGKAAKKV